MFEKRTNVTGWKTLLPSGPSFRGGYELYRAYRRLRLILKRCDKRGLPARIKNATGRASTLNDAWFLDLMAALGHGRRFQTFNVLDDFNLEALRIEIDTSLPARRLIRALTELFEIRG